MKKIFLIGLGLSVLSIFGLINLSGAGVPLHQDLRVKAYRATQDGNYKQAFEMYEKLSLDPANDPKMVANDLEEAIRCLRNLNRHNETDDLRERVIGVHQNNWRLLFRAALNYFNEDHSGYIVAGKFERSYHRGGGQYVNSIQRDHIRSLQLLTQAASRIPANENKNDQADFYLEFARILMGYNQYGESWRLQYLSDLLQLPDYEESYYYPQPPKGAPVDAQGRPVFHALPRTYGEAKSDGAGC